MNESASDGDASRVVVLSSAKSAIAFLLAGAVGTLGPSVLAISASGEVPLAVVIATLFWTVASVGILLHGGNPLRTTVRLNEHTLSIDRPFGSLEISSGEVADIDVWTFERLGPMRPTWFGDAVARVRCTSGKTPPFAVHQTARPAWAPEPFRRLFV